MLSTPTLIFMAVFSLLSLAAMLQNGFVVVVLGREWTQSRALPAVEMIMVCLTSSRFCLHGIALLNNFLAALGFCYQANFVGILWDFMNTLLFWLTAWLATFYCVKTSIFSHPVLLWLKGRISQLVPRLIVASLIMGGISAIISAVGNIIVFQMTTSQGSHGNCTFGHRTVAFYQYYNQSHMMLMWLTPFVLFLLSIVFLMCSLYRHMGRMRNLRPGLCDPTTQAHTMALKSLASFLISYTFFVLFLIVSATKRITMHSHWHWAREIITYTGIFLHSVILVLSSPKLRKALKDLCTGRLWALKALDKGVSVLK
uniref:taste receptor type 2 member 143-like n=1 Tax=Jaculus jaculus TaxID=51337 RepID=UPI001E1B272D|nr:taste receptor type 2 member 143-like [Jaculus jaculus]